MAARTRLGYQLRYRGDRYANAWGSARGPRKYPFATRTLWHTESIGDFYGGARGLVHATMPA